MTFFISFHRVILLILSCAWWGRKLFYCHKKYRLLTVQVVKINQKAFTFQIFFGVLLPEAENGAKARCRVSA